MIIQPGTYAILTPDLLMVREIKTFTQTAEVDGTRIRNVVVTAKPTFNAASEKVIQNGWQIDAVNATTIWVVLPLTQSELDAKAELEAAQTLVTIANNFIAGSGTATQVRESLGKLIKRLVRKDILP